jgi:hypothetical protein
MYKKHFSSSASAKILKDALLNPREEYSYEEAKKELMYFQKKKDKIVKWYSMYMNVFNVRDNDSYLELSFNANNYTTHDGKKYIVYVDGKETALEDEIRNEVPHESFYEEFKIKINAKKKPTVIKIRFLEDNIEKNVRFRETDHDYYREIGLVCKKDRIVYYHYYGLSKIKSIIYLLKYNREGLKRRINKKLFKKS